MLVQLNDEEKYDTTTVLRFTRYSDEFRNFFDSVTLLDRPHSHAQPNDAFPAFKTAISTSLSSFESEVNGHVHILTLINAAIALVDIGHRICDHPGPLGHMIRQSRQPDRVVKMLAWVFDKLFMKQRLVLARRPVESTTFGRHLRALVSKASGCGIMSGLEKAVNVLLAPDDSVDMDGC